MKTALLIPQCRALCAAIALGVLASLPAAHAESAPRIDALQVAKIAANYLASHGKDAPYIVSIALEPDALMGGNISWVVRWSRPLMADGNKEVGMRVKLDGAVSYLVADKSGQKKPKVRLKS
jgi:hypothetical protein